MGRKKAEPVQAPELPPGTAWRTAVQPGSLTHHFAAIGLASLLGEAGPGTTAFGAAGVVDTIGERPPGLHIWTVGDPGRVGRFRDWLLAWPGKPTGDRAAELDRVLALSPGQPEGPWLDALAAEGVRACWQGPISLGPDDGRGPRLPILVNRRSLDPGCDGWAVALPYWPRNNWNTVSVFVRAADLFHQRAIGDLAMRPHSWATYPVADVPAEIEPPAKGGES